MPWIAAWQAIGEVEPFNGLFIDGGTALTLDKSKKWLACLKGLAG